MSTHEHAISKPPADVSFTRTSNVLMQRQCACGGASSAGRECQECQEKDTVLQRKAVGHQSPAFAAPPIVNEVLNSPGTALDALTRGFFETRFGHDFSQVRVHSDGRATESARAVNALAYTVGRHIVFEEGQYSPRSNGGRRLLAHELAHVTQQGQQHKIPSRITVGRTDSHLEREADRVSQQVINAGTSEHLLPTGGSFTPQLQRQPGGGKASTRQATVAVHWSEEADEFLDRLINALSHSGGFRGIDPGEYRSYRQGEVSFPQTVQAFHYSLRHDELKEGKRIKVVVSADYNRSHEFHESDLSNFQISRVEKPAADPTGDKPSAPDTTAPGTGKAPAPVATTSGTPKASASTRAATSSAPASCRTVPKSDEAPAARVLREADETACVMATLLLDAYKHDPTGMTITITFDGFGLPYPNFEVDKATREREPGEVSFSYAEVLRVAKAEVDLLVPFGPGDLTVYFSFEGGLHAQKTTRTAAKEPVPPPAAEEPSAECDPSDSNYGECLIEERKLAYQAGILAAGEVADAYYNPFSVGGDDGEMGALAKVPRVGKFFKVLNAGRKGRRGLRIKVPNVLEYRGLGATAEKLDVKIMESVLDYRSSAHGSTPDSFNRNFAAARIRFETGETAIIKALNVPKGTHAEEEVLGVLVDEIKRTGKKARVEQIFSERVPCPGCWHEIIQKHFGEDTSIFYFIGNAQDRAAELRKLYF